MSPVNRSDERSHLPSSTDKSKPYAFNVLSPEVGSTPANALPNNILHVMTDQQRSSQGINNNLLVNTCPGRELFEATSTRSNSTDSVEVTPPAMPIPASMDEAITSTTITSPVDTVTITELGVLQPSYIQPVTAYQHPTYNAPTQQDPTFFCDYSSREVFGNLPVLQGQVAANNGDYTHMLDYVSYTNGATQYPRMVSQGPPTTTCPTDMFTNPGSTRSPLRYGTGASPGNITATSSGQYLAETPHYVQPSPPQAVAYGPQNSGVSQSTQPLNSYNNGVSQNNYPPQYPRQQRHLRQPITSHLNAQDVPSPSHQGCPQPNVQRISPNQEYRQSPTTVASPAVSNGAAQFTTANKNITPSPPTMAYMPPQMEASMMHGNVAMFAGADQMPAAVASTSYGSNYNIRSVSQQPQQHQQQFPSATAASAMNGYPPQPPYVDFQYYSQKVFMPSTSASIENRQQQGTPSPVGRYTRGSAASTKRSRRSKYTTFYCLAWNGNERR